jgi:hypothetical protein
MLIASQGRGILAAVIAGGCLLATELCTRACFHDDKYYQQHGWPKLVGFLVAAGLVWGMLPRRESGLSAGGAMRTRESGGVFQEQDQLLLVPVRYWPAILCALGIVFYVVRV